MPVIRARYADRCRECGRAINPGDNINFGGRDAVSCVGCRPLARVKVGRYGTTVHGGHAATGRRCEDAPCCGCCD